MPKSKQPETEGEEEVCMLCGEGIEEDHSKIQIPNDLEEIDREKQACFETMDLVLSRMGEGQMHVVCFDNVRGIYLAATDLRYFTRKLLDMDSISIEEYERIRGMVWMVREYLLEKHGVR